MSRGSQLLIEEDSNSYQDQETTTIDATKCDDREMNLSDLEDNNEDSDLDDRYIPLQNLRIENNTQSRSQSAESISADVTMITNDEDDEFEDSIAELEFNVRRFLSVDLERRSECR